MPFGLDANFMGLMCGNMAMAMQALPMFLGCWEKYHGGGDYYANPTALPNLITFCNTELHTKISKEVPYVEVGSKDLMQYPFVHMTGHGNVVFSKAEVQNLRTYLLAGGFLHIDDNYGMDGFVRAELKKVLPEYPLTELPTTKVRFSTVLRLKPKKFVHPSNNAFPKPVWGLKAFHIESPTQ